MIFFYRYCILLFLFVSEMTNHSDQQTRVFFKRNIVMFRRLQASKTFVRAYKITIFGANLQNFKH